MIYQIATDNISRRERVSSVVLSSRRCGQMDALPLEKIEEAKTQTMSTTIGIRKPDVSVIWDKPQEPRKGA